MGLVEEQVRVCRRQVEAMEAVKRGAELAVEECQYQFHSRRWNCSTLQGLQVFGKVAIQGQQGQAEHAGLAWGPCSMQGGLVWLPSHANTAVLEWHACATANINILPKFHHLARPGF